MASARVMLIRGSLMLNAVLVIYLCLTRLSTTPSYQQQQKQNSLTANNIFQQDSGAVYARQAPLQEQEEGQNKPSTSMNGALNVDQPPESGAPQQLPPAVLPPVADEGGLRDISLGGRRTLGQLPDPEVPAAAPPAPVVPAAGTGDTGSGRGGTGGGGDTAGGEPEEPPREVQESVGVTEHLVAPEPLANDSPDPPMDSMERKMYPDLRECTTRPLRPFYQQRGDYWVLENYIPAVMSFRCDESITYTTHGDYTFLDNLEPLTSRWQGPVSVAVYAPGTDFEATVNTILYLRDCWAEGIKKYVTFHIFFHVAHTPKKVPPTEELMKRKTDCGQEPPKWTNVTTYKQQKQLLYPVNIARNTARLAAQTYFVFPSDVELYPSINFIPDFFKMLKQPDASNTSQPRVFVFPIFEVKENVAVPEKKAELQKMLNTKDAIPFHKNVCPKCHGVPKSKEWISAPVQPGVSVFHVGKRAPPFHKWEPIYVGTNREPLYDERLSWEGKSDKMTQMYILCVRDYEFHILDNAFLVHKPGIKHHHKEPKRDKIVARQNSAIASKILPEYKAIFGVRKSCII